MMNQPKLRNDGIHPAPQAAPTTQATALRLRPWTFAPSADEDVTWPLSLEVEPWRP